MRTQKSASAKTGHMCKQHASQQTIFCDEKTCQVLLCPTCILVKHRDHKLIDIPDKADQIRDELRELKTKTIDQKNKFTKQIEKMNIIKEVVNTSASKALDEVDNARSKQLKELENAMKEVQKEAEIEKTKITQNQQKQLNDVELTSVDLKKKKKDLEECIKLIAQFIEAREAIDVILNNDIINQIFKEISKKKDAITWMANYEIMSFEAGAGPVLQRKPLGKTSTKTNVIDYHDLQASLGACGGASVDTEMEAPAVRGMPGTATKVKSWQAGGHLIRSSPNGKIYTASIGGIRQIQTFDMNGIKKMETNATSTIKGMTCHHTGGKDTLIIAMEGMIQLRDGVSGSLLDTLNIPGFKPHEVICQDSQDTVLIGGAIGRQQKAIQCMIKDGKITQSNKQINVPLSFIEGLASVSHNNKKYVVATDCDSKTIVAVDFDTGAELWRLQNAMYNGQQVRPWGICTDGGSHLLLADFNSKRILVLDMEGQIKRELIANIPGQYCFHVTFIRPLNKLAVTYTSSYNAVLYYVGVYDVEYDI